MSNPSGKFFTYQGFRWELHVNSHDTVIVTMAEIVDSERDHVKLFMENPFNLLDKMTYDPAFPMILTLQVGKSICAVTPYAQIDKEKGSIWGFKGIYTNTVFSIGPVVLKGAVLPLFSSKHVMIPDSIASDNEEEIWKTAAFAFDKFGLYIDKISTSFDISHSCVALGDMINADYYINRRRSGLLEDEDDGYGFNGDIRQSIVASITTFRTLVPEEIYYDYAEILHKNPACSAARPVLQDIDVTSDPDHIIVSVTYIMRTAWNMAFVDIADTNEVNAAMKDNFFLQISPDEKKPVMPSYIYLLEQRFQNSLMMSKPDIECWGLAKKIAVEGDRKEIAGHDAIPIRGPSPDAIICNLRQTADATSMDILSLLVSVCKGEIALVDRLTGIKEYWHKNRFSYSGILKPTFYRPVPNIEKMASVAYNANTPSSKEMRDGTPFNEYRDTALKYLNPDWSKKVIEVCSVVVNLNQWIQNTASDDTKTPRVWMLTKFCRDYCRYWLKKGYDYIFINGCTPEGIDTLCMDGIDPDTDFRYSIMIYRSDSLPKHTDKDFIDEGGHVVWMQDHSHG